MKFWILVILVSIYDVFLQFRGFPKISKIEVIDDRGPGKYAKMQKLANIAIFCRSAVIEIFNFLLFMETSENQGKHHYLTSGQLRYIYSLIWRQNMQKSENTKNFNFPQVRSHRNIHFFSAKPLKIKENIIT